MMLLWKHTLLICALALLAGPGLADASELSFEFGPRVSAHTSVVDSYGHANYLEPEFSLGFSVGGLFVPTLLFSEKQRVEIVTGLLYAHRTFAGSSVEFIGGPPLGGRVSGQLQSLELPILVGFAQHLTNALSMHFRLGVYFGYGEWSVNAGDTFFDFAAPQFELGVGIDADQSTTKLSLYGQFPWGYFDTDDGYESYYQTYGLSLDWLF